MRRYVWKLFVSGVYTGHHFFGRNTADFYAKLTPGDVVVARGWINVKA